MPPDLELLPDDPDFDPLPLLLEPLPLIPLLLKEPPLIPPLLEEPPPIDPLLPEPLPDPDLLFLLSLFGIFQTPFILS